MRAPAAFLHRLPAAHRLPSQDAIDAELAAMTTEDIVTRARLIDNQCKVRPERCRRASAAFALTFPGRAQIMRSELIRLEHENLANDERIKENQEKIKLNDQLPCVRFPAEPSPPSPPPAALTARSIPDTWLPTCRSCLTCSPRMRR